MKKNQGKSDLASEDIALGLLFSLVRFCWLLIKIETKKTSKKKSTKSKKSSYRFFLCSFSAAVPLRLKEIIICAFIYLVREFVYLFMLISHKMP